MTWSVSVKIPAGKKFVADEAGLEVPEEYKDDLLEATELVPFLDTFNGDLERTVTMSGFHSGMTNNISVAVSQVP